MCLLLTVISKRQQPSNKECHSSWFHTPFQAQDDSIPIWRGWSEACPTGWKDARQTNMAPVANRWLTTVLCIPPGVSALGHKDKCSVITHQVKQGHLWSKKHSLVQTLYIPKWTFAPAPHPRGLKRDFLRFSESRFQTNSVSTAREDRERPLFRISSFVMNRLFSGRRLLIVTSWLAGALA